MPYTIKQYNDGFRVVSDKNHILSKKPMTYEQAHKQLVAVSLKEGLFGGSSDDNYKLHAVIFKKPINLETVIEESMNIMHKKKTPFIRETHQSYRVRNIPKTKFYKDSFRTKIINPSISLIFGELK
jgi:hypothetical protein